MNDKLDNINEDSVGTVLPITQPDEVLRKDEIKEPSPDEAFDAIDPSFLAPVNSTSSFDNGKPMATEETELETEPTSLDAMMEEGGSYKDARTLLLFAIKSYQKNLAKIKSPLPNEKVINRALNDASNNLSSILKDLNKMNQHKEDGKNDTHVTSVFIKTILNSTSDLIKRISIDSLGTTKKALSNRQKDIDKEIKKMDALNTGFIMDKFRGSITVCSLALGDVRRAVADIYKYRKGDSSVLEEADGEELPYDNSYDEFVDRLAELGIESVIQEDAEYDDRVQVWEGWGDDEIIYEAANIDDDMKEVIQTLNSKGYGTVYSCSGHPSARLKSDKLRDGIKYGKVYSTARVVFDKKYDFKDIPKYWEKKDLDDKIGIYVKGPTYNIVNGMRAQQFEKWKKRYMYNLRQWADNLPAKDGSKPSEEEKENEKILNEDVNEELTSMLNDLIMDGDAE
jgi:hypothetical protein